MYNDDLFKLKLQIEFMNEGIVPLGLRNGGAPIFFDINKVLAEMPRAEARKMRRKFRKLWRQIVSKEIGHGGKNGRRVAHAAGHQAQIPDRRSKNNRKHMVFAAVVKKVTKEELKKS